MRQLMFEKVSWILVGALFLLVVGAVTVIPTEETCPPVDRLQCEKVNP